MVPVLLVGITTILLNPTRAQVVPLKPQSDTCNSTFTFDRSQLSGANLSDVQVANVDQALNFERSNWATVIVATDSLNTTPSNSSSLQPGSLLKVEPFVDPINYTLAPNTAISRILFNTQNLRNDTVPASAVILWPYQPSQYADLTAPNLTVDSSRFPLEAWGHGTSGQFAECGPSHTRNLWYQYNAIFELALSGYVVVAPDYQSLDVNTTANGTTIVHPYAAAQPVANNIFYAVQAAQEAFANLVSKKFIIMGHSQGGAAAWAAAMRQSQQPVDGYLGAFAASPPPNVGNLIVNGMFSTAYSLNVAEAVRSLYPDFSVSSLMTSEGAARLRIAREQSMCNSALGELFADSTLVGEGSPFLTDWTERAEVQGFLYNSELGIRLIAGPMLVLQGLADLAVPYQMVDTYVEETCTANGGKGIQYAWFDNVTHVPVLFASRPLWLGIPRERFSSVGAPQTAGTGEDIDYVTTNYTSLPMPVGNYQKELGYYLKLATTPYQVA